jgi:hypothetical protein
VGRGSAVGTLLLADTVKSAAAPRLPVLTLDADV